MRKTVQKDGKYRSQYTANLAYAAVASQVGCVTILIVAVSLIVGLWLDNRFDTSPIILVTVLVLSAPVTIVIMLWIVRSVTARIKPSVGKIEISEEELNRGTDD
jgi:F0F1-type ATP synthase assembly protein I